MKKNLVTPKTTNISNNTFTGIKFNKNTIKTVDKVAEALLNLTKLFNTQNIHIDSLLEINGDDINKALEKHNRDI